MNTLYNLLYANYAMRGAKLLPDEWYWADHLLFSVGYNYKVKECAPITSTSAPRTINFSPAAWPVTTRISCAFERTNDLQRSAIPFHRHI